MSVGTPASLSASAYLTTEALKIKPDRGGYEAREGEQKNKIFLALRRQPQNNKLDILKLEVFVFFFRPHIFPSPSKASGFFLERSCIQNKQEVELTTDWESIATT